MAFDHKNALWLGTDSGLVKYDSTSWTVYTPENSPMELFWIWAVAVDKDNNVWFGNGNHDVGGLMCLSGNEWKLFTPENSSLKSSIIYDILIDSSNTIWVGTESGLARIYGNSWKIYDRSNSILPYIWIDDLGLDMEGKIWVGQEAIYSSDLGAGALLTVSPDGNNWSFNNPSQTGKATNRIRAIACDKRGYMWVSTNFDIGGDYAVSIYNKKQWISFSLSKGDTSRPYAVISIAVDKHNNIWFGAYDGLLMLKQDTSAIDSLFAKEGVGVKREFRLIPKSKKEMLYHDVLGRKSSIKGDDVKKAIGVLIGSDNIKTKKIVTVK